MKNLLTFTLLLLALLLPVNAHAYDFEVNGLYYEVSGNEATVVGYGNCSGSMSIPTTINYNGDTYPVTEIAPCALASCSGLISINIPNSIAKIGYNAFAGCSELTSINIPNSVTEIGPGAFQGCSGLTKMTVASSNQYYDSRNNCNAIIETSSNTLIAGCKNTVILNSVTSIGTAAFFECSGLTSVTIPNSVTAIGHVAFSQCKNLTSITIPNSVTEIGWQAFYGSSGLTSISIPNSVTSIEQETFYECTGLTSITIPNSVTTIGLAAFLRCSSLTDITIPNSVTEIGDFAFYECTELTNVSIPNSVTYIGYNAFDECRGLTDVYSYITDLSNVSTGYNIFSLSNYDYSNRILHVPIGTLAAYQADANWGPCFSSILEMQQETILVNSIELDKNEAEVIVGETLQLIATVMPENATTKTVTWSSSDETIATIDVNGLVTAKAPGTAIITAMTTDGSSLSASCVVTVKPHATSMNGDVNGDGKINLDDLTALINYLLTKHW